MDPLGRAGISDYLLWFALFVIILLATHSSLASDEDEVDEEAAAFLESSCWLQGLGISKGNGCHNRCEVRTSEHYSNKSLISTCVKLCIKPE